MSNRPAIVSQADADTPLRLDVAAALAFPDGTLTASGLRREAKRGRLVIERVAGKDYTTLAHIKRMRELCRQEVKAPVYGYARQGETLPAESATSPSGSSATESTAKALAAAKMLVNKLKHGSQSTSTGSTSGRRRKANVVRLKFPSRTR